MTQDPKAGWEVVSDNPWDNIPNLLSLLSAAPSYMIDSQELETCFSTTRALRLVSSIMNQTSQPTTSCIIFSAFIEPISKLLVVLNPISLIICPKRIRSVPRRATRMCFRPLTRHFQVPRFVDWIRPIIFKVLVFLFCVLHAGIIA